MVKKEKETIMVHSEKERADRTRHILSRDVKPMNTIEQQRWLKAERNHHHNTKNRLGTWACRLTIPLSNITELKRAGRELSALAKKFNEIAVNGTTEDDRVKLAQVYCTSTNHELKQNAVGYDERTNAYRGMK